jgi:hypothetical protein
MAEWNASALAEILGGEECACAGLPPEKRSMVAVASAAIAATSAKRLVLAMVIVYLP